MSVPIAMVQMKNLNEKFLQTCERFCDREAMRIKTMDGWKVCVYGELREQSRKISSWLKGRGLKPRETVGLIVDNGPLWAQIYFGILLAGGVVVPLDPQAKEKDLSKFLADADVRFLFLESRLAAVSYPWPLAKEKIVEVDSVQNILSIVLSERPMADDRPLFISPDDTVAVLYSSGTTANPKGVELTHKNFLANVASLEKLGLCSGDDVFISVLPLFHSFAFTGTLLFPLFLGAKIVYPNTKKSQELLEAMQGTGVTVMAGVPELFKTIHKSINEKLKNMPVGGRFVLGGLTTLAYGVRQGIGINLNKILYGSLQKRFGKKLRFFVSGGAKLDPKIARDFERWGFTVMEGYGLTETSPIVSLNLPQANKIGSVGKAVSGVEVRILNPDAQGVGEIIIRGENVMKGYYRKPEETAQVIKDGWFYSGDLGFIDRDGFISISGRIKEVIVLSSGKNIFPEEIEDAYKQSMFVKEVGVFLSLGGEAESLGLRAVIVPHFEEFQKKGIINIYEKIKWDVENISKELSSYKRIMGFVISKEDLPITRLGKIKRFQLEAIYNREKTRNITQNNARESQEHDPLLDSPVGKKVLDFLSTELKLDRPLFLSDHLELDLGIDSLARVELVAGLERLCKVRIPDEVLAKVATVRDIIEQMVNLLLEQTPQKELEQSYRISWQDILRAVKPAEMFKDLNLQSGFGQRVLGMMAKGWIYLTFKIFCRLKVYGRDHLPLQGPYILCCNHSSYLDAFVVIAGLPTKIFQQTHFIGLKEIFCHPSVRWSMKLARLVPIDPTGELTKALQSAAFLLQNSKMICIFPEGQRSIDGEIKKFKKGVGILAQELNVDLIPVAIEGTYRAWPRTVNWPKPYPIKVAFGRPIKAKEILASMKSGEDTYEFIAGALREKVITLKKETAGTVPTR